MTILLYTILALLGGAIFGVLANRVALSDDHYKQANIAGTMGIKRIGQYDGEQPVKLWDNELDESWLQDPDWWKKC